MSPEIAQLRNQRLMARRRFEIDAHELLLRPITRSLIVVRSADVRLQLCDIRSRRSNLRRLAPGFVAAHHREQTDMVPPARPRCARRSPHRPDALRLRSILTTGQGLRERCDPLPRTSSGPASHRPRPARAALRCGRLRPCGCRLVRSEASRLRRCRAQHSFMSDAIAVSISRLIRSSAASGSGARVIGRPMTR